MNSGQSMLENSPSTYHVVLNALLFQGLWFAAILSTWFWAMVMLSLMVCHYLIIKRDNELPFLRLIILAILGISFDRFFQFIGVYHFDLGSLLIPLADFPLWLASLWIGFCLTLPVSLAWALKKPYLFIVLCSLGGPLSYLAGRKLEALDFADHNLWFLVLEWFVFALIALFVLLPKLGMSRASPLFLQKESSC